MRRRSLLVALVIAAPAAAPSGPAAPASALAAKHRRPAYPVVTSISPRRLAIGRTLSVRGRNFRSGRGRNTVVFQRAGGRYVFVRAGTATPRRLRVTVPAKLGRFLLRSGGRPVPTRFRIRVLASRFGERFTSRALSPVVLPGTTGTNGPCVATPEGDADRDGLANRLEKEIGTDPCLADTDGEGLSDFWEYWSAVDYNDNAHYTANDGDLPYPGKRPYPNPLDPTDANIDHDGDGLDARDEFAAWARFGTPGSQYLFMSDGTQNSMERKPGFGYQPGGSGDIDRGHLPAPAPSPSAPWRLDINGNGWLTDDERDADSDGVGNWDERYGRMTPKWWEAAFKEEKPYKLSRFEQTDWLSNDTDGDGVVDGRDDIDHDGWANWREIDRFHANYRYGDQRRNDGRGYYGYWTNPFNPCLPDYTNRAFPDRPLDGANPKETCSKHPPFESSWAPFEQIPTENCDPNDPRDLPPYRWYRPGGLLAGCPVEETNPSPL